MHLSIPPQRSCARAWLAASQAIESTGDAYNVVVDEAAKTDRNPAADEKGIMIPLLGLAGEAGQLLTEYKKLLRDGDSHAQFRERFTEELGDILWYLADIASKFELSLADVARRNLDKCQRRWGIPPDRQPFDAAFSENERFPRRFLVDFATARDKQERPVVRVSYNGEPLGDTLTDNAYEQDGYGFHDVLHLSFAAVLGWSPLMRKLLKIKRKSNAKVDEIEDGARAVYTEEGLSTMVFAYAKDNNWLAGKPSVSSELLRTIKCMTSHLEVAACTEGEWEEAIVQGFAAWRQIKDRRGGTLVIDLDMRSVTLKG